jgi:hypothetical protein
MSRSGNSRSRVISKIPISLTQPVVRTTSLNEGSRFTRDFFVQARTIRQLETDPRSPDFVNGAAETYHIDRQRQRGNDC